MSEEVTYATLTFQDSAGARNNRDGNNLRKRGHPAPSPIWRHAALGLVTLCLMLLIGLVTLGMMFLQISNDINSDSEKLSQLQKTIQQQQDNLSQQLGNSNNLSMEEEFLKSQISSVLKRQEQMAIKLCQELIIHTSGFSYVTAITHVFVLLAGIIMGLLWQKLVLGRWLCSLSILI
ncbi:C-type lectin domain family 12 member B isoform X4 [Homo sapiens]|uniref:C-type lectin domain family 12 member B isoform X4 n=1 Tax=Homo sapiens TaxID=9606 RepID=UPI0005D03AFB|nr:C-type lectin domain family 12 member B isoform X4 [Homo sapiens]|eukprot:XP_011518965.1 C-type lectin domain family 12 member B isoform X4 [Homo sapiens]